MLFDAITDIFIDTSVDTLKILPFLFLAYLFMEYIESGAARRSALILEKSRILGPFWGALLGMIPQCGFSASASGLFSGGLISTGTLMAVYLSTSDEMLPIFFSEHVPVATILRILFLKALMGMISGFLLNAFLRRLRKKHDHVKHIHDLCQRDHCHCESEQSIWMPALRHTIRIGVYIFLVTLLLSGLISLIGEDRLAALLQNIPVIGLLISGLIGLIPNCAASVILTQIYLKGLISTGMMMTGLLVGAGVGILVLWRTNEDRFENLRITAGLYLIGLFWGILIQLSGISL